MTKQNNKTEKTIEKKIKTRIIYCVCLILLGAVALILGTVSSVEISDYASGFYTGVGGGLIAAGIITIIRHIRTLKNKERLREKEVYEKDERNRMIGLKTWSYAGWIMFIALYVGMLIAGFISEIVLNTLLIVLAVYALCIFFARVYCEKTM